MNHQFHFPSWRLIPLLAMGLAGCATDNAGPNGARGRVSLRVTAQRPTSSFTAAAVLQAGDSTVITLGQDTVTIRSVEFVLRKIELKPVEATLCADDENDAEGTSDDSADEEECEEVEAGPDHQHRQVQYLPELVVRGSTRGSRRSNAPRRRESVRATAR